LNQGTAGANFALLGLCMVDIKKGSFNDNVALEGGVIGGDYNASATTTNAFAVTNAGLNGWFTADLTLLLP
jgi:hypothetical protein